MRVRLFNKAVKKGQLQTAAQILDSLGKVIGESVETVNIQAPELSIKVEPKIKRYIFKFPALAYKKFFVLIYPPSP